MAAFMSLSVTSVRNERIRRRFKAVWEDYAVIDRAHEVHVAHAIFGDLLMTPGAEFIIDATAVNPLPLRALHPQNLGQPIKRHILARRPLIPMVHGVEDWL